MLSEIREESNSPLGGSTLSGPKGSWGDGGWGGYGFIKKQLEARESLVQWVAFTQLSPMITPLFTIGHSTPSIEDALRSLVADALVGRGIEINHLFDAQQAEPHRLTPFAIVEGTVVRYPKAG